MPTKACQKLCCFYSTELLEAKAKAVGATATSRSLMLLLVVCFFDGGDSGQGVRGSLRNHNFCRFSDQLGSIPCCLELFRNGKFSLEKGQKNKVI